MGHAAAPVVANHRIAFVAQRLHDLCHIAGDGALAVGLPLRIGRRARAVAVAAQVDQHHAELRGQPLRHRQAGAVVLRVAVQHEHGRAAARVVRLDHHAFAQDVALRLESQAHPSTVILRLVMICW